MTTFQDIMRQAAVQAAVLNIQAMERQLGLWRRLFRRCKAGEPAQARGPEADTPFIVAAKEPR